MARTVGVVNVFLHVVGAAVSRAAVARSRDAAQIISQSSRPATPLRPIAATTGDATTGAGCGVPTQPRARHWEIAGDAGGHRQGAATSLTLGDWYPIDCHRAVGAAAVVAVDPPSAQSLVVGAPCATPQGGSPASSQGCGKRRPYRSHGGRVRVGAWGRCRTGMRCALWPQSSNMGVGGG